MKNKNTFTPSTKLVANVILMTLALSGSAATPPAPGNSPAPPPGRNTPDLPRAGEGFLLHGTVTRVDAHSGVVTARIVGATKKTETLAAARIVQLQLSPQQASTLRVGQRARANLSLTQVALTSFPIQGSQRDDLHHSDRMETSFTLSRNGRIDAKTRTWTSEALRGFTGAVIVGITDQDGNVLFTTQPKSFGVNGTSVPGAPSDRTAYWNETVPEEVVNAAGGYVIYHVRNPTDRVLITLGQTIEVAKLVKDLIQVVKEIVAQVQTTAPGH